MGRSSWRTHLGGHNPLPFGDQSAFGAKAIPPAAISFVALECAHLVELSWMRRNRNKETSRWLIQAYSQLDHCKWNPKATVHTVDTTNCIQSKLFEAEDASDADAPDWDKSDPHSGGGAERMEFQWPSVWQTTFNSFDYLETHGAVAAGISTIIMWHWQDSLVYRNSVMGLYNVDIFQVLEGQN